MRIMFNSSVLDHMFHSMWAVLHFCTWIYRVYAKVCILKYFILLYCSYYVSLINLAEMAGIFDEVSEFDDGKYADIALAWIRGWS